MVSTSVEPRKKRAPRIGHQWNTGCVNRDPYVNLWNSPYITGQDFIPYNYIQQVSRVFFIAHLGEFYFGNQPQLTSRILPLAESKMLHWLRCNKMGGWTSRVLQIWHVFQTCHFSKLLSLEASPGCCAFLMLLWLFPYFSEQRWPCLQEICIGKLDFPVSQRPFNIQIMLELLIINL